MVKDKKERSFFKKHGLSLAFLAILLVQTLVALYFGHIVWMGDQQDHQNALDYADFWSWWLYEYNVSLVADVFGALLLVLLTKKLYEKDSEESS